MLLTTGLVRRIFGIPAAQDNGGALGGSVLLAWLDLLGDVEGAAPEWRSAAA